MLKRKISIIAVLLAILAIFIAMQPAPPVLADDDEGSITIYNNTDRDLYIVIAGRNQGNVTKGYSETYRCRHGNHRVVAQWDGGEVYKYITVSRSSPRAEWQINQNDID